MPEGRPFSPAAFSRMWQSGVSSAEMAAHFDCSTRTITHRANALHLPKRKGGVASKYDCRLLAKMYADGVGTREIAAALGLPSPTHVPRMIAAMGLPRRSQASGRWGVTVSADEWREGLLSRAMARTAAQEQASMINAEMADGVQGGGKLVGQRKAGGA